MNEPFENEIKVLVGTQEIHVDETGRVTVVHAGPVGPQGVDGNSNIADNPRLPQFGRFVGFTDAVDETATVIYVATPTPEMTGGSPDLIVPLGWSVQESFTIPELLAITASMPVVLIPTGEHVGLWRIVEDGPWEQIPVATGQRVFILAGGYNGYPATWAGWNANLSGAPDPDAPPTSFVFESHDTEWINFPHATAGNYLDTDPVELSAPDEVENYVSTSGTRVLTEVLNSLVNEKPWSTPVGHVLLADPETFDPLTNTESFPITFGEETVVAEQYVLVAFTDGDDRSGIYKACDGSKWLKVHPRWNRINWVHVDNVESPYDKTRWFKSSHPNRLGQWKQLVTHSDSNLLLPDPTELPDGKTVKVESGLWVPGDAEAGSSLPIITEVAPTGTGFSNLGTFSTAAATHQLTALNRRLFVPIFLVADTYNRVKINVTASAASTWRLGIHEIDANALPKAAVLADFGTVDTSGSAGERPITISFAAPYTGWYWVQIQVNAYTATPTVTSVQGQGSHPLLPLGFPTDILNVTRSRAGFYDTNGTGGALDNAPTSWSGVAFANDAVRVWIYKI